MKWYKLTLFGLICGLIGSVIHLMCQDHGIFMCGLSGLVLGFLIARVLLSFDSIKNYFYDFKKNSEFCGYECECCWPFQKPGGEK